jgi:hypothetical protein
MTLNKRKRPTPGDSITKIIRIPICKTCGYMIEEEFSGCTYECPDDYEHNEENTLYAIYERTDVFLRDE